MSYRNVRFRDHRFFHKPQEWNQISRLIFQRFTHPACLWFSKMVFVFGIFIPDFKFNVVPIIPQIPNPSVRFLTMVLDLPTQLVLFVPLPTQHSCKCEISGFRREVDGNRALLGYHPASRGNFLPMFRDKLSVPFWSANFKTVQIFCPEISCTELPLQVAQAQFSNFQLFSTLS